MFETNGDTLNLYKQGIGSMLFCLDDLGPKAAARSFDALIDRINTSRNLCEHARKLDYDWQQSKLSGPAKRNEAMKTDVKIDRTLGQIFTIAQTFATGETDSPQRAAGQRITQSVFRKGVFPITALKYEDQHASVHELSHRLQNELAGDIDTLGLSGMVANLVEFNDLFGQQLSVHDNVLTFDMVQAARQEAEESFARVVLLALALTMDDLAARSELLSAVRDQQERTARYRRRRSTMPVVDAETGEIIDAEEGDDSGTLADVNAGAPIGGHSPALSE
ncbi:hypothetical protein EA187_12870 [Lujinxingia sediminis]|uniref:Uncharacterized protein n=1 Tax=Lujinxingia sediminis TaxID=2480984 RepID=A0ABY0CRP6_9DELT|nr:DUF6261 family protein [Lujinxingia sediminis]RVU43101.1 hypothetical protein EA187_12870 [Lujinxingia sediminis]